MVPFVIMAIASNGYDASLPQDLILMVLQNSLLNREKYREFFKTNRNLAQRSAQLTAYHRDLDGKFPTQSNREFFAVSCERSGWNRDYVRANRDFV
jgi:hypothetical protein